MKDAEDEAFEAIEKAQGWRKRQVEELKGESMSKILIEEDVVKLALEALEVHWNTPHVDGCDLALGKKVKAITALRQAIEQAQQEPVEFETWYENSIWGDEDFKAGCKRAWQAAIKHYTPPQRQPLMDEQGIWVLTSEHNAYDQYGEYFEAVFIGKPTSEQIQKHCHVTELGAAHILSGGGRVKYEDQWYNLRKEEAVYGIKGKV